jgi:hypothetical protein
MGIWEGFSPVNVTPHVEPSLLLDPVTTPAHRDLLDVREDAHSRSRSRRSHSPADDLHGNFHAALLALALRSGDKSSSTWKFPAVSTSRALQRQVALQLCGWSLKDEDLWNSVKRFASLRPGNQVETNAPSGGRRMGNTPEPLVGSSLHSSTPKQSKFSCEAMVRFSTCVHAHTLSHGVDESHHMMSGTLAALMSGSSTKGPELREHCERLIIRLQDPYFRAMLTHLTLGDWSEVLDEELIPFRERLAIAFQFLDDKALTSYLYRCVENSSHRGDIDGLIVTGLTKRGMDILQGHVDRTGDVQTAAILASYACPFKFTDARAERWVEAYRDLLDAFKLHHYRVSFDIERGGLVQDAVQHGDRASVEWAPQQILIRCSYCNKPVINDVPGSTTAPKHRVRPKLDILGSCLTVL